MSCTSVSSDYIQSDADQASEVLLRFQDLQRESSSTAASWDDDDDRDDTSEADATCEVQAVVPLSVWYLWNLVSSTVAFSVVTVGCVWNLEVMALLSLPLQFIADLSQYVNAWPPALSLLALLTVLAIVLQPEGYTWVLLRKAGDCLLTGLQESSTVWAILINNFGSVISTIMAACVFFGLFFIIYVLHKALSPRPKRHLQYHDANSLDLKQGKKRRKKPHGKATAKVNNRLQPHVSNNASQQCPPEPAAALPRCETPVQHAPRQSLTDTLADILVEERRISNDMLPALLEDSPVNAPIESPPQASSNSPLSRRPNNKPRSMSAKPLPTKGSLGGATECIPHAALRSRTLSASSEATTASFSDSSMSSRSDITMSEIQAPPGFEKKATPVSTRKGEAVSTLHASTSKSSRRFARTTNSAIPLTMAPAAPSPWPKNTPRKDAWTYPKSGPASPSATGSGLGQPVPAPAPPGLDTLSASVFANNLPSSPASKLPLFNQTPSIGELSPVAYSPPARTSMVSTVTATKNVCKEPAQIPAGLNASASPFGTPSPSGSSYFSSAPILSEYEPIGVSSLSAHSPVWDGSMRVTTASPIRVAVPPPPGIPADPVHLVNDSLMLPSFGASSKESLPASWTYGGLVDANADAAHHRAFETPRSALYMNHHPTVRENPFFIDEENNNDDDIEQIEAELQELGGRMIGSLLDF